MNEISVMTFQVRFRKPVLWLGIAAYTLHLDRLADWLIDRCVTVADGKAHR